MSICLLRKSTSSRAERLLRNKACCVGLRTRRACLTSEGQRPRLTRISDCARNWDLDKIYRIGKLTEFTSATTRHSAFSASAVFPRPEVAPSRGGSYLSRPRVAFSRDRKGLSRVRFAHSRAGSCFSVRGEAPSSDRRGLFRLGSTLSGRAAPSSVLNSDCAREV